MVYGFDKKTILVSNDVKRDKRKSVGEDWCGGNYKGA